MVGDGGRRGASLEICLSKLLHLNTCQIVGMSATLSNIRDLSSFLKAEVYTNNFRPVGMNARSTVGAHFNSDYIFNYIPQRQICFEQGNTILTIAFVWPGHGNILIIVIRTCLPFWNVTLGM